MDFEQVLRMTIAMFGKCHVLGSETEMFNGAMSNLKNMADTLKREKEKRKGETGDDHDHDEQGQGI